MANRLKMAIVTSIVTLAKRGWSQRRIARELGVSRTTVRGYLAGLGADSTCTGNPPPGSASGSNWSTNPPPGSNMPAGPSVSGHGPASSCEAYREIIEVKLAQGLSGVRIWQDLVAEHGFGHSYDSVKRYLRRLGQTTPLPFRRMEVEPGAEGQVDFGTGPPIVPSEGRRRKTHVFRIVLSHSRKAYSENVFRQTTDAFLGALENAFWHFGGVPRTLVVDNLKAAVKNADWFDPELNPKVQSFCEHYGTVMLPAKPYTPRHKGKIERGIGYVQGQRVEGPAVRDAGGVERAPAGVGDGGGGHADSRDDASSGGQGVRGDRAAGVAALAGGPVPVVQGGPAERAPGRARRGGQGVLLGAAGVRGTPSLGPLGRASGTGVQPADGVDRDARPAGGGSSQHAERAHPRPEVLEGGTRRGGLAARGVVDRAGGRPMGQGDAGRTRGGRSSGAGRAAILDPPLRRRRGRPGVRGGVGPRAVSPAADPGVAEAGRRRGGRPGAVRIPRRTRDHPGHGAVRRRGSPGPPGAAVRTAAVPHESHKR